MGKEVTLVHEEVMFHGVQSIQEPAFIEDDCKKLLRTPQISFVDVLVDFKLIFLLDSSLWDLIVVGIHR